VPPPCASLPKASACRRLPSRRHRGEGGLSVHAARGGQRLRVGGQLPAFLDEFVGDQGLVVHHRLEPVDEPLPSGSSVNSCSNRMPSLGLGLKMLVPIPPMVTSRSMRPGFWMAKLMRTAPPIELPTMCTLSTPSASGTVPPRLGSDHRMAAEVGADAEAGEFQDQAAEMFGERGQDPPKVAPASNPGPEPCRNSSTGPESAPQS